MNTHKSKTSFQELINSETPVLIDFYADWCGPCKAFAPTLDNLKHELGDKVKIIKIDVDRNEQLSNQLQIRSIPTVMLFQNGELKWQALGAQSIQTLRREIEALSAR